jgi:dATP pyrophosphohydrolase
MPRAPYQVLVIPFRLRPDGRHEYAVLLRSDGDLHQFIAGGGEEGEAPLDAAIREAAEEGGIAPGRPWTRLKSCSPIPRRHFPGGAHWPADITAVPEHCFAIDITGDELRLSSEHRKCAWLTYDQALARLTWASNRAALQELNQSLIERRTV